MKGATFARLAELRAAGTPVALLTNLRSGSQLLVTASGSEGELCLDVDMVAAAQDALKSDESTSFETPAGKVFVHVFAPPPRLVVVGAVHIAEPLARMGALAGYGVTIVDPRRAFAASQSFDGIAVSGDWPDEAMEKLRPDMRTAVVTLTHDPKLDDLVQRAVAGNTDVAEAVARVRAARALRSGSSPDRKLRAACSSAAGEPAAAVDSALRRCPGACQ